MISDEPILNGPSDIVEHTESTFTCSSTGGNPKAEFRWLRDYSGPEREEITTWVTPGDGQSELRWTPDRNNDGDHIICQVKQQDDIREKNHLVVVICKYQ